MAISCAMPLALTRFYCHKNPPEALHGGCRGGCWSCVCPRPCSQSLAVGMAGLQAGEDAPGRKLCSVKSDKGPSLSSSPLFPLNEILMSSWHCWKKEGANVEIEFLSIHTFFTHYIMFSAPSLAVLYRVIGKQNPAHLFLPFSSFPPRRMDVGALSKANASSP